MTASLSGLCVSSIIDVTISQLMAETFRRSAGVAAACGGLLISGGCCSINGQPKCQAKAWERRPACHWSCGTRPPDLALPATRFSPLCSRILKAKWHHLRLLNFGSAPPPSPANSQPCVWRAQGRVSLVAALHHLWWEKLHVSIGN